jgi:hypothetical protein
MVLHLLNAHLDVMREEVLCTRELLLEIVRENVHERFGVDDQECAVAVHASGIGCSTNSQEITTVKRRRPSVIAQQ